MSQTSFNGLLFQDGNNTGIEVPEQNMAELNAGKRVPVSVSINGYVYQSTVTVMGGKYLIPFAKAHRDASGIQGGDEIEVLLTVDTSPRTFQLPDDALHAVEAAGARPAFDKLPPSRQKEYVRSIEEAKKPETRAARIAKLVATLEERK